jgi:hypothetical protein
MERNHRRSFYSSTWSLWRSCGVVLLGLILLTPFRTAAAIELRPGDVLTSGYTLFYDGNDLIPHLAIVHVDPVTRVHSYLSGGGVGNGPEIVAPAGIAVRGTRDVFLADEAKLLRIDPVTGDRTTVSGPGIGSGTLWQFASGAWLRDDQSLLLVDRTAKSVISVDLLTGDRTVVSSPTVGSGPAFIDPVQITTTLDGQILVTSYGTTTAEDEYHGMVVSVDPATGDRTILSDATHGGGPGYISPIGITRRASGKILVTDDWPAKIFEVDPTTGTQTVFTESVPPATPVRNQFVSPRGVAEGPDGTVYFVDPDNGLMRVDANGGWASRVQGGPGVEIGQSNFIAVVQVPEPAGIVLLSIGVAGLIAASRTCRRPQRKSEQCN